MIKNDCEALKRKTLDALLQYPKLFTNETEMKEIYFIKYNFAQALASDKAS